MAEAPSVWWRLLLVLCRYAGLRCPSEVLTLRWADIHWAEGYMVIDAPKTGLRRCPLFPRVREVLSEAWELAPEGAEYVFPAEWRLRGNSSRGWRNVNLRTNLTELLKRLGITPWPNLFHALRKSAETDLVGRYPLPVVAQWLGNSPMIAYRHYLDVTDSILREAAEAAWPVSQRAEGTGPGRRVVRQQCGLTGGLEPDGTEAQREERPPYLVLAASSCQ